MKGLVFGQLWYTVLVIWHTFNCLLVSGPMTVSGEGLVLKAKVGVNIWLIIILFILTPDDATAGAVLPRPCSLKVPQSKGLWSSPGVWGLVLTDSVLWPVYDGASGPKYLAWCLFLEVSLWRLCCSGGCVSAAWPFSDNHSVWWHRF